MIDLLVIFYLSVILVLSCTLHNFLSTFKAPKQKIYRLHCSFNTEINLNHRFFKCYSLFLCHVNLFRLCFDCDNLILAHFDTRRQIKNDDRIV